jgi:nucleoside 2-deoxyribosyltransferase
MRTWSGVFPPSPYRDKNRRFRPRAGLGHGCEMRIYLAGPDVFLPDAAARGAALKGVCARHGLVGVFPLDPLAEAEPAAWAALPAWQRIARRNEAHIRAAAALIANLTPFRGPSADVGTVFELGFARALGLPVFGWTATSTDFSARTRAFLGTAARLGDDGTWRDGEGLAVEAFGCADNLMIDGAIAASGGALEVAELVREERWRDLAAFERCVRRAAALLGVL